VDIDTIGKYSIISKIGQGAMGQVYRAHDPVLNRFVAIKTMTVLVGTDEELRRRFHREAQSAARLNHPNIITVYEFGEEQGNAYMVMELLEGTDLKDLIGNRGISSVQEKMDLMEQICEGLAFAHAMEVVHRDLKPANIHIQLNGQVKIMDFGLARLGASEMTKSGVVMGTPNYMSPEQVRGERADARSDIFALGAVFYELLTNHKPFNADSMHAVLYQVLQNDPEPPRHWVPDLPPALVSVVDKALSKDPSERFQNAGEMLVALRQARQALEWESGFAGDLSRTTVGPLDSESTEIGPPPRTYTGRRSRVEGSAALDLGASVKPTGASVTPRTLSGKAPTHVDSSMQVPPRLEVSAPPASMAAPPARPSRVPLLVGAAGLGAVAVALGGWLLTRGGTADDADRVGSSQVLGALTQQLVGSQVLLARKHLEDKDYRGAMAQAEGALKLDASNAEAQEVLERARAVLADLDAAAEEAHSAFDSGDSARASRALSRVLALDPNHPVAAELSGRLNSQFRAEAEDARQAARRAQGAAERSKASGLSSFGEGTALAREGEGSFRGSEFAVATRKFFDARDSFDRARRAAEERAAARTPPPAPRTVAAAPATTLPPVTAPPTTVPAATPPPVTLPPITAPPATVPAATLPPPTLPPATPAPVNDEPAIRKLVAEYARAIEQKDLALFRAIKPNLSPDEEQRLRAAFQATSSQQVTISIVELRISGGQATVRINRRDAVDGHVAASQQTLLLAKSGGGWMIREIGR